MKRFIFSLLLCELFALTGLAGDKTIKGHIVDDKGNNVEFVSIHVDSIYAVSDKEGYFSITIPQGMTQKLRFSHISYQPLIVPYSVYNKKNDLRLTLKEKVNDLSAVAVVSSKKQKSIFGKGMRVPGDVAFKDIQNTTYEVGPLFTPNTDYYVRSASLRVQECTFTSCTIRMIIYEVKGKQLIPIQHRPAYLHLSKVPDKKDFTLSLDEPVNLMNDHKYYVGIAVVHTNGTGELHFPAYFRKGCYRNLCTGRQKQFPVSMGVSLYGGRK